MVSRRGQTKSSALRLSAWETYSTNALAPALLETKSCYLAGVITGSLEKGKKWAQNSVSPNGDIFSYETMADLKNAPDIDIVYVVTPNALHAQHAIAAARAGKHVISRKTIHNLCG